MKINKYWLVSIFLLNALQSAALGAVRPTEDMICRYCFTCILPVAGAFAAAPSLGEQEMLLGTTSTDNISDTCQSCGLVHEVLLVLVNNDCDWKKADFLLKDLGAPAGDAPDILRAFLAQEGRRSPSVSSLPVTVGESFFDDDNDDLRGEGLGCFHELLSKK